MEYDESMECEYTEELPEDMTKLQSAAIDRQNQMILQIAEEIAQSNTTIADLHVEFAERMQYADYDADDMISQLEGWVPGSRQRVEDAISQVFEREYPLEENL